jgi:hypothetical protein
LFASQLNSYGHNGFQVAKLRFEDFLDMSLKEPDIEFAAGELAMIDLASLTFVHTALSYVALLTGAIVVAGLFGLRINQIWTAIFLLTAIATSATGFLFPFNQVLPSHIVGGVALLVLAAAMVGMYVFHLAGYWRRIYAAGIVASLYLLVFVGIAQAFMKIAVLKQLAPTTTELPFAVAQGVTLLIFIAIGVMATRGFRAPPVAT